MIGIEEFSYLSTLICSKKKNSPIDFRLKLQNVTNIKFHITVPGQSKDTDQMIPRLFLCISNTKVLILNYT